MQNHGDRYEELAARWLLAQGWQVVQRNFRCKLGEIDIIALDHGQLVFVEVRARRNPRFSSAAASVDRRKQQKLLRAARFFLQCSTRWQNMPCRFDVLAFDPPQSDPEPAPRWIRSAFSA